MEEEKQSAFFDGLNKMMSSAVMIRGTTDKKLRVIDLNKVQVQSNLETNRLIDRFARVIMPIRTYGYDYSYAFQGSRIEIYRDYEQMDMYPILSSALDIYADECIGSATIVPMVDGRKITIKELYDNNEKNFLIYGIDANSKKIKIIEASHIAYNGKKQVYKITLDDSTEIKCTANHEWVRFDNELIRTDKLAEGDWLCALPQEYQIIKIEKLEGLSDVYDIVNAGDNHIFAIETNDGGKLFTHNCTLKNLYGRIVEIKTDKDYIADSLNNLFYDVLNIDFNLWAWVRNLVKYGDFWLKMDITEKLGITNVIPLSPYGVQRVENPNNPEMTEFHYDAALGNYMYGQSLQKFKNYEIVHFRLLSDMNYLPYGRSIFESARQLWKQIVLLQDAMLIHKLMRAPERRVIKVDIGNIPPAEVDNYMNSVINKMKKVPYLDEKTGQYNLRFNLMPVAYYTNIPLLDGRTITIKQLAEETKKGKKNYVYSIDRENDNKIVSGEVQRCELTKKDADIVRIWLDDDSYIDFELEHPVMLRTGEYKAAKDLIENDSLMPFYSKFSNEKGIKDYEMIFDPADQIFKYTHRVIAEQYNIDNYIENNHVVHHADFNRKNNIPENLDCKMTFDDHIKYHRDNIKLWLNTLTPQQWEIINKKRSDTWKKNRILGKNKLWNEGETKETNELVRLLGENISKTFTPEKKKKYAARLRGKLNPVHSKWIQENFVPYERTEEHKQVLREKMSGDNNPNYGKTWEEIHGKEKAEELREKVSNVSRDKFLKNNPMKTDAQKKRASKVMKFENGKRWSDNNFKEKVTIAMSHTYDSWLIEQIKKQIKLCNLKNLNEIVNHLNKCNDIVSYFAILNETKKGTGKFSRHSIAKFAIRLGYKNIAELILDVKNNYIINHKVKKVEFLTEKIDVYCMLVKDYHNFAIDSHGGNIRDGIFVKNTMLEDFYLPVRPGQVNSSIDTLQGLVMDFTPDLEFLLSQMFAAIKIPKAFLGYEEGLSAKNVLLTQDVRFARTIERVQRIVESELYKIAIIHLYSQGYTGDDLVNYKIQLTPSSILYEEERNTLLTNKVDLVGRIREQNLLPDKYIYEELFNFSEQEWHQMRKDMIEDLKWQYRIKQISDEGVDPYEEANKIKNLLTKQEGAGEFDLAKGEEQGGGAGEDIFGGSSFGGLGGGTETEGGTEDIFGAGEVGGAEGTPPTEGGPENITAGYKSGKNLLYSPNNIIRLKLTNYIKQRGNTKSSKYILSEVLNQLEHEQEDIFNSGYFDEKNLE